MKIIIPISTFLAVFLTSFHAVYSMDPAAQSRAVDVETMKKNPVATVDFVVNGSGDNLPLMKGVREQTVLGVGAIDFGRRRIGGDYSKDAYGNDALIVIRNVSSKDMTIVSVGMSGQISEFWPSGSTIGSHFTGLVIKPDSEARYPLHFVPTQTQNATLKLSLVTDGGSTIPVNAVGIGIIPHLSIEDLNFPTLNLSGGFPVSNMKFHITNLDMTTSPQWEFYDDATITDLVEVGGGHKIGPGGTTDIGTERFSFDKTQLGLPLRLKAGEISQAFDAWYQPILPGSNTAQLQTVSDAETQPISTWRGAAVGDPAGVSESRITFYIFPSPARDWVEIQCEKVSRWSVILYNIIGTEVLRTGTDHSEKLRIDLSSLDHGMYTVRVSDDSRTTSAIIIK